MRKIKTAKWLCLPLVVLICSPAGSVWAEDSWVVYEGKRGPGKGKHIVLVSGDEEYRSEEILPQMGKILAVHHGFKCTVLFAIDPRSGTIDPNNTGNIPGLKVLRTADLMIINLRERDLPDKQMKHFVDYVESGRPIIGMRASTHAFEIEGRSKYKKYCHKGDDWEGGFGRQVLGEEWVNHHGKHNREGTRGVIAPGMKNHPIVKGIKPGDIWGPSDVYGISDDGRGLHGGCKPLVLGQVLRGMKPNDPPVDDGKNNPMMPIAWTKSHKGAKGKTARIFTTTMGASQDIIKPGLRRLLINASYWCLGMEDKIDPNSKVDFVGRYKPSPFGNNKFKKGVKPSDHKL